MPVYAWGGLCVSVCLCVHRMCVRCVWVCGGVWYVCDDEWECVCVRFCCVCLCVVCM